jgi:hypothetical protein
VTDTNDEPVSTTARFIDEVFRTSQMLFVKKLSNNDRDWASRTEKHQGGVYVPQRERDSGFFPPLSAKVREPGEAEIREAFFETEWPQTGERKTSRLVNYTSKGVETHLTGVPKAAFSELSPASWLIIGRGSSDRNDHYVCATVDAACDDALLLLDSLDLSPEFSIGILDLSAVFAAEHTKVLTFAEQLLQAWLAGAIVDFAEEQGLMPPTATLAAMARANFLREQGLKTLNPFELETPGDVVRTISRVIEWNLFREFQRRERAIELVRLLFGDTPRDFDLKIVIGQLVDSVSAIDRLMLSASQQRKSRAGYSFEHQIEALLIDGRIPFEKQVIIESKKRPDFVLPSLTHLREPAGAAAGLILSAKTTLRERWKQVSLEMKGSDLFLTTVDEDVSANAIEDMADLDIQLVVPESLKCSTDTEYVRHDNIIDFRTFFRDELGMKRLPSWI